MIRIENPRVGGSIPPPGTIKNSDKTRLVRVLLFLPSPFLPDYLTTSPKSDNSAAM